MAEESRDSKGQGFHYSREERLAGKPERDRETGGPFRRNRSLLIILLDIVLVLVMFVIYLLFVRPEDSITLLAGFSLDGSAFVFDEQVYLTLTIADTGDVPTLPGAESLVRVVFPDGTGVTDTLPTDPDFPTVVRHVIGGPAAQPYLQADAVPVEVSARGESVTLDLPMRR